MTPEQIERVARAYFPEGFSFARWHYHYARIKLKTDPLYPGVLKALSGNQAPLLDIGCGIGLLAQLLRDNGVATPYTGVDFDARKIQMAKLGAKKRALYEVLFEQRDVTRGLPTHSGSVTLLDVLQFLPDDAARWQLLRDAMQCVSDDGLFVIRTGIEEANVTSAFTGWVDNLSKHWGWMRTGASRYPKLDVLQAFLAEGGFDVQTSPLKENTPFNNWLLVARRV